MQILRSGFDSIPSSPRRQLYGNLNGMLIAPIDIILFKTNVTNGDDELDLPISSGSFDDAVVMTSGTPLGSISDSPWPPTDFMDVQPFVKININPSIDSSIFPDVRSTAIPTLVKDAPVELVRDDGSNIKGKISDPVIKGRPYVNFGFQVNGFIVRFNQRLLKDRHGSRIVLSSGGQLIGMLISTQNNTDGTCDALVFPADLIR